VGLRAEIDANHLTQPRANARAVVEFGDGA
jgi:hypothetical protein